MLLRQLVASLHIGSQHAECARIHLNINDISSLKRDVELCFDFMRDAARLRNQLEKEGVL
jgi:hypothetical protein